MARSITIADTKEKDIINWRKSDFEALNKTTELFELFEGGFASKSVCFSVRNDYNKNNNSRFYMCGKCDFARECNSVRQAKMIKRLHMKKCKGE